MTTKEQGIIGQAKVLSQFESLGIPVSIPFGDNLPYDLIIDVYGKLYKIQVKTSSQTKDGKTDFGIKRNRNNTNKTYISYYNKNDVDFYALYAINRDKVFLVPFQEAGVSSIIIRYEYPKNNQLLKVKMEQDYSIQKILKLDTLFAPQSSG